MSKSTALALLIMVAAVTPLSVMAGSKMDEVVTDSRAGFLSAVRVKGGDPYDFLYDDAIVNKEKLYRIAFGFHLVGDDPAQSYAPILGGLLNVAEANPSWEFQDWIDQLYLNLIVSGSDKTLNDMVKNDQQFLLYVLENFTRTSLREVYEMVMKKSGECSDRLGAMPPRKRPENKWLFCRGYASTGLAVGYDWDDLYFP